MNAGARGTPGAVNVAARQHECLSLRLPVQARSVGIGRRAAAQFAEEAGCSPETLWRVRLSVSEALSNVVLHAHATDEDAAESVVELLAAYDGACCEVTITDTGDGLQAREDSPGMGLGLALIANSCDELALDAGSAGGTVVRMRFNR